MASEPEYSAVIAAREWYVVSPSNLTAPVYSGDHLTVDVTFGLPQVRRVDGDGFVYEGNLLDELTK